MTLHVSAQRRGRGILEQHRRHAAQRRNERALARALSTATSPAEVRDLRSLASR